VTHVGCFNDGYSIIVNGNVYDESNPSGVESLVNAAGCDSIVTIDLTFNASIIENVNYVGCIGDGYSILVNGTQFDESNPVGIETLMSATV